MLGSGTLWTRPTTLWIFWSEILTCRSGSSPDTLNLRHEGNSLAEQLQASPQSTCVAEGRGGGRMERGREGHLGIRASLSTMHLASWTAKSMGCRMC